MTVRVSESALAVEKMRDALEHREHQVVRTREMRDEAVRAAVAAGESKVSVARLAGLSRQQVYNILAAGAGPEELKPEPLEDEEVPAAGPVLQAQSSLRSRLDAAKSVKEER